MQTSLVTAGPVDHTGTVGICPQFRATGSYGDMGTGPHHFFVDKINQFYYNSDYAHHIGGHTGPHFLR